MDTGLSGFIKKLPLVSLPIIENLQISPGAFVLTVERISDFLPGQVVALSIDNRIAPRLYSISSAPDNEHLQVLFSLKPEGELTPLLARLKPGDTLRVSAPFGAFLGDERPAWWIAAGTGVAPYRAMMLAGLAHNKKLIHGGRFANQFYFQDEFLDCFGKNYIRCCSQEIGSGLYPGRLTQWLCEQVLPSGISFFLCGSAEMVVETRDILISKGVEFENIMSEIYF